MQAFLTLFADFSLTFYFRLFIFTGGPGAFGHRKAVLRLWALKKAVVQ